MTMKTTLHHNRTKNVIPANVNKLEEQLEDFHGYANINDMKITKRRPTLCLNTARSRDFTPKLAFDGDHIEVVE